MALPIINLSVVPVFPANVVASEPVIVTKAGLTYSFSLDPFRYAVDPAPVAGQTQILALDTVTQTTSRVDLSVFQTGLSIVAAQITDSTATGRAILTGNDVAGRAALGLGALAVKSVADLTTDISGTLGILNGGTGQTTAPAAFDALKQSATTTATGVVELATNAEVQAQASSSVVVTPSNLAQRVAFFAHKNGTNQTTITSGTETKLTFGTESYDIGGYYDTSNSRFTPPAGRYFVSAVALTSGGGVDQAAMGLLIYKNGVRYRADFDSWSGTTNKSARISTTVEANGTDYFEVFFVGFGAGDKAINGTADSTFFTAGAI